MTDKRRQKRIVELEDFRLWLTGLDSKPILHINGPNYPTAVITVDFGTPLEDVKLSPELAGDLVNRMRTATKTLCRDKEANARVQSDNSNGIWWSSIG